VDHVATLLVELGLLFLGLSLLGLLARRLGLSPIPFVLLAALALGEGGLVPMATAAPFVETAAEIGVILLLLALGLEFTAEELVGSLRHHGPSGLVDLLLNAPPGFLAGLLLGLPWPAALALGGITWISSSGIVARLLGDLGRLANRETPSVLAVLVLEDLAMALYLPVLVVALAGGGRCAPRAASRWP
jgi:CPA2 family monovalent cation:H+ antiporter-2